jgi:prepilin-type N-terminal cleavage/methylation domain-containing protein
MHRHGFTIAELIIVITIMGILLVLGVVNLRSSQVQIRDDERRGDIEAIGLNLESFYSTGSSSSTALGRYPSTALVGSEQTYLQDIDPKSLIAPGDTVSGLVAATCSGTCVQTTAGVAPQPTIYQYVYQPIKSDGTLCINETQECRKFNLYYHLEADDTIYMITSRNQ